MILTALALAMLQAAPAAPAPSAPASKPLSLEQQTAMRCSAAFAIVSVEQARGEPRSAGYPVLGLRAREFFVRSSAQIMEERDLGRAAMTDRLEAEARTLRQPGVLEAAMPACLLLLDASGL